MFERFALPDPPRTGRSATLIEEHDQPGFWGQVQQVLRGFTNVYAAYAHDPDAELRSLGQRAMQRRHPQADDYFVIGDRCAQLTLSDGVLNTHYAVKTLIAYDRARSIAPDENHVASAALVDFGHWVGETALAIGSYDALKTGLLVCERVQHMHLVDAPPYAVQRLADLEAQLAKQLGQLVSEESTSELGEHVTLAREARAHRDRGHLLLRQEQSQEALICLERSLQIDDAQSATWQLCATALIDLGRYDDALVAYQRALLLVPTDASLWNSQGALLLELGRTLQALEAFEHGLEHASENTSLQALLLLNKGKAFFALKRYEEALAVLQQSQALHESPEASAGVAACRELLNEV